MDEKQIHPIIALIGKAIAIHLKFRETPKDDDMLIDFIEKQVKIYKEGK